MPVTLADSWQPDFGVPYPFRHHPPTMEEARALQAKDPEADRIWGDLLEQQPAAADVNPIEWGYVLPSWQRMLRYWGKYHTHVILGGNRSTKSTLCSRLAIHLMEQIPEARIRCWSTNEDSSINDQQRMVWDALPAAYKHLRAKRGSASYSVQYSQKNGFSGGKLILPPRAGSKSGSELLFQTYKSYGNDPQVAEGWWAHLIWADEEMPAKLFETLQYRTKDVRGRLLLSFTTLQGWTPLVADILAKTRTLERRHSSLLGRELPYVQESLSRPGTVIWYFWTEDNPFMPGGVDDFMASLAPRPEEEKLARAHGIPTRATGSKFPLFDDAVHVVKHEDLPFIRDSRTTDGKNLPAYKVTRFMALDPAGSKNWFMLWVAVDAADTVWAYDEWPDTSFGDWAEASNDAKGKPGPAQKGLGYGIRDYVGVMRDREEAGGSVFERVLDPRMGTAEKQGKEGATSIHTELEEEGLVFQLAPGVDIEHGLQLINDRLKWDQSKPVGATNAPRLFVSDRCQNLIFALKNFTAAGGKDEACKDPIDCLRYLLENGVEHIEQASLEVTGVGSY